MERGDDGATGRSDASGEAARVVLGAIDDLMKAGVSPAMARKLADLTQDLTESEATRPPKRRVFGAFAGQFAIGSEFFEALSEDEIESWAAT